MRLTRKNLARTTIATATVALASVALSACASPTVAADNSPATDLVNCGQRVTVATAPKRVVTIKSTSTEMLLALGLQNRIVGTAFQDGPPAKQWQSAADKLPVISDQLPSEEALLTYHPDFVYAGWESNFGANGVGDRSTLQTLGIGTYVSPSACKAAPYKPKKLSFDDVFAEIDQVGKIFNVQSRADQLVAAQRKQLRQVVPVSGRPTALWYSSGNYVPYVGAGIGAPQLVMSAAGFTNIAAGVNDTWTSLGWEAIAAKDPQVIILIDASWNTAAQKMTALASNPLTANLSAVRNKRYLILPFAESEAGVRSVDAVQQLITQMRTLK